MEWEFLPAYAPRLNSGEHIRGYCKAAQVESFWKQADWF